MAWSGCTIELLKTHGTRGQNLFLRDLPLDFEYGIQVGHFFFNTFSHLPDYDGTANAKHYIEEKNDRANVFVKFRG